MGFNVSNNNLQSTSAFAATPKSAERVQILRDITASAKVQAFANSQNWRLLPNHTALRRSQESPSVETDSSLDGYYALKGIYSGEWSSKPNDRYDLSPDLTQEERAKAYAKAQEMLQPGDESDENYNDFQIKRRSADPADAPNG